MKSRLASVCLPAWLLGHDPGAKIICASYAQNLSSDFAFQMRRLMQTPWYRQVFPRTHIDPRNPALRRSLLPVGATEFPPRSEAP